MIKQKTIAVDVSYTGIGLHSGTEVNMKLRPAPLTPFTMFSQNSGTLLPTGVMAPRPVTTTLFNSILMKSDNYLACSSM